MEFERVPVEWTVTYPVHPDHPIGRIRRESDGFHAWFREEDLGLQPDGDTAAVAIWDRFRESTAAQHAEVSITHGGRERHRS